ncbi:hypothetical protein PLESTB_000701200 [Pleodorina starrii]|uniref:LysM domain-containing protein n=1 Tax=Pleodorina starrii TaxID=330485 RepID=A0A9W6F1M3_9CHLO|nr:hypothetical protein PLESTM_001215500 [Pleodorina starrii]GLC53037.1 hypothetical protein PLESTB_000701200 [Pleodorina starrii]GLC75015.1 hypothetical protein PLESTF_001583900 [Pleodorina starrii]
MTSRWSVLGQMSREPEAHTPDTSSRIVHSQVSSKDASDPAYVAITLALSRLSPQGLGQCRAVCKLWREAASGPEVRRAAFMQHWRLAGLVGEPRNPSLFDTAGLGHFVRRHAVARGDTLTGLAVRHGCGVTAIMRLNNLITHHSLHSREAVFLPVSSPSEVAGSHALFEYCRIACREFLVLLSGAEAEAARKAEAQLHGADGGQEGSGGGGGDGGRRTGQEEALQGKLVALLGRSRQLDEATARFYLIDAGWCLKKALELYEQDLRWETCSPGRCRRRRGPLLPLPE